MLIWTISDPHQRHSLLDIPNGIDMVICAGDVSNQKDPINNEHEVMNFLQWFKSLTHIKYKVLIAGNHDTSIEKGLVTRGDIGEGIIYLQHESVIIDGIKLFGSPYTPAFNDWAFNVKRGRLQPYWDEIPKDTDILITHGPPYGILDLTESGDEEHLHHGGDKELFNKVKEVKPQYHIFGHFHTEKEALNAGIYRNHSLGKTQFINTSVCNKRLEVVNNGFILNYHGDRVNNKLKEIFK